MSCSLAQGGSWPADFTVVVSASSVSDTLATCTDSKTATRAVHVNLKPVVEILVDAPGITQVCSSETSVTLGYTVSSGASGQGLAVSAVTNSTAVECTTTTPTGM